MSLAKDADWHTETPAQGWLGKPWTALHQPSFRRLFYAAIVGSLLSKLGALLPGMSPDDYFFAFPLHDANTLTTFVAQGRALNVLLVQGAAAMGLSLVSIQTPALLLALLATSLFIAAAVNAVADKASSSALAICAAAIAATHPYLSSYFLFRMAIPNQALAYGVLFVATWALSCETPAAHRKFIVCTALLALWCNSTQIVLLIFSVTGMAWALAQGFRVLDRGCGYRAALRPAAFVVGILICSGVLYFASSLAVRKITGIPASVEYTPHLDHGLKGLLVTEGRLAWSLVSGVESVVPLGLKIIFFCLLAITLGVAVLRRPRWGWAGIAVLVSGMLVTVLPMTLSWGGSVPRTFSTLGVALALSLALASNALGHRTGKWLTLLFSPVILAFCLLSGTMFHQQAQLTGWDQQTAAGIYRDASASGLLRSGRTLRLVAPWPYHSQALSIDGPGVNESALRYDWSYPGLFAVAMGERLSVMAGDPVLCQGHATWPAPGAIRLVGESDVYVCLK